MRCAWVLLLLLVGCSFHSVNYSSDFDYVHMYGDRLDATPGRRIIAWVADHEGETIRWVYDVVPRQIAEAPIHTWPGTMQARDDLAGVIVILPPGRDDAVRGRVRAFMEEATRTSENAGRHVVVGRGPWFDVNDGNTLHARLRELHELAARNRLTSGDDGIFLQGATLVDLVPDDHVVPIRESKERFAVFGSFVDAVGDGIEVLPPKEMSANEVLGLRTNRKGKHPQTRFYV